MIGFAKSLVRFPWRIVAFVCLVLVVEQNLAAPYYYLASDGSLQDTNAGQQIQQAASDATEKVKDAASSAQEVVSNNVKQPAIRDHLTDLYAHASSAVKGLADSVQPDFKNLGKDLGEVYQSTRSRVGERMEPLAHTVRPYIDQAQKAVEPIVSRAREEVPKALHKVSDQMRDGISRTIDRLRTSNGSQQPISLTSSDSTQLQHVADTNTIGQAANSITSTVKNASSSVQNAASSVQDAASTAVSTAAPEAAKPE